MIFRFFHFPEHSVYKVILLLRLPQGHGQPQGNNHIDLRYSVDALKAISDLQLGSCPRAILKIRPPSSLDYRARHGLQTNGLQIYKRSKSKIPIKSVFIIR